MAYSVEINRRTVSYRDDDGEWMEGHHVTLSEDPTEVETFDPTEDPYDTPFYWAINLLEAEGFTEPSSYPIQGAAHEWLSGSYTDPYTGHMDEVTARLTGDWTERQRADVFHAVSTVTYHDPKN